MKITFDIIGTIARAPFGFALLEDMTFPFVKTSADRTNKSDRSFGSMLTTVLALNFAGTLLAVLLEAIFRSDELPGQVAANFMDSFVYSSYIGTSVGFAILHFTPRLNRQKFPLNWILLVGMILGLTYLGSLAAGFTLMAAGLFPPDDYSWLTLRRMSLGFLIALVFGASAYFYESVRLKLKATAEHLKAKESAEESARKHAAEASLSSLESRLRPHFLFNTLNSISALIAEDAPLAERMVERFAALLRFSLDSNHRRTIPLEQELKIAVDYLEIEKARFGARLRYSADVPAEFYNVEVPPFLIQTLVENSVKYAVAVKREGGAISIKARAAGEQLQIEVWDDGAGFTEEAIVAGHGLDNLRARLAAIFEGKAGLEMSKKDGFAVVRVCLPNQPFEGRKIV